MDPWSQQAIGLAAINSLARLWPRGDPCIGSTLKDLGQEVHDGRCVLLQDGEGIVTRIVAISMLLLTRSDGRFLVQLAKFRSGALELLPSLPACKQTRAESPPMAVERVLRERFSTISDVIELGSAEVQIEEQKPRVRRGRLEVQIGQAVRTKYIRTLHRGSFVGANISTTPIQTMMSTTKTTFSTTPNTMSITPTTMSSMASLKVSSSKTVNRWLRQKPQRPSRMSVTALRHGREAFKDDLGNVYVWLNNREFANLEEASNDALIADWVSMLDSQHDQLRPLSAEASDETTMAI
jgi:hypothetical protein